jgi:hypothetical protein
MCYGFEGVSVQSIRRLLKAASLIEKETLPLASFIRGLKEKMNIEHRTPNIE